MADLRAQVAELLLKATANTSAGADASGQPNASAASGDAPNAEFVFHKSITANLALPSDITTKPDGSIPKPKGTAGARGKDGTLGYNLMRELGLDRSIPPHKFFYNFLRVRRQSHQYYHISDYYAHIACGPREYDALGHHAPRPLGQAGRNQAREVLQ